MFSRLMISQRHRYLVSGYLRYFILAALIYVPVFGFLGALPIRLWDESRLVMNAWEMLHNRNWLVTHFDGSPDLWNTKPPLLIWLQVAAIRLFGFNEVAVRIPSALAALFTCVIIMCLSQRYLRSFWFGFIAVLVLITTNGYIGEHAARTGDYEALLTLCTTASGLLFFMYMEKGGSRYLYALAISLALAVFTKGVGGLLFLPGMVLYALYQRRVRALLRNRHFYLALAVFVFPVVSYYLLREARAPGSLQAVYSNELGGRFFHVLEGHKGGFWYYFSHLVNERFGEWYLLVPCGAAVGLFIRNGRLNRLTLFVLFISLSYFLIISVAQSKLEWYDVPLYPWLAILVAVFVHTVFRLIAVNRLLRRALRVNVAPYVLLFLLAIAPYENILDRTYKQTDVGQKREFYEMSYFIRSALDGRIQIHNHRLLYQGCDTHLKFYLQLLKAKGIEVYIADRYDLTGPQPVIAYANPEGAFIDDHYEYKLMSQIGNVAVYEIIGAKHRD